MIYPEADNPFELWQYKYGWSDREYNYSYVREWKNDKRFYEIRWANIDMYGPFPAKILKERFKTSHKKVED